MDEDGDTSGDQGAGDNKYQVTIVASGGKHAIEVEVDERKRAWKRVTLTSSQAQATRDAREADLQGQ